MTDLVVFENFSLLPQGPTLSLRLAPGETLAIVGPAASGKTRLIRCLSGLERPAQGTVHVSGKPAVAGKDGISKRSTPQSIARHGTEGQKHGHTADALSCTGLWDLRQKSIMDLSGSQRVACELLACLTINSGVIIIDTQLDRLDPWTLASVFAFIRKRLSAGEGLVAVTHRPEMLPHFDKVLVLDHHQVVFSGSVPDLLKRTPKSEVEVESNLQAGARALVEPFRVGVTQNQNSLIFHAEDGQELAAKLLLEGYGDISYVVLREPTPEQALMHLTKTPMKKLSGR
jgi:ABC-type multidrug transport system ATPase subunit